MSRRIVFALIAVVCGLGAVFGAGFLLTSTRSTSISSNVLITGLSQIDALNSPTILHNPTRPSNLVVTYRVDRPNFSAVLQHSSDGGKTWAATALPLPNGTPPCAATIAAQPCPFTPDAVFDSKGTLYVIYVNLVGSGNGPDNLWVAKSTDGGASLQQSSRIAGGTGQIFQPRIAVAPDGTLYVTWLQAAQTAPLSILGTNPIVAAHSADGGQSWSPPVVISDSDRNRVGAATPAVDGRGTVTVLYEDFKGDNRDFENLDGPVFEDPFSLVVTRSTDGGKTWSRGIELDAGVVPTRRFFVDLPIFPSIAIQPNGTIYVAWADGRNGDEDVFVKRSPDGGKTWSAAVRVNNDSIKDGTSQYLPQISVTSDGQVDVLFYDRRRDPLNVMNDAELATSNNGGKSFKNRRISSVAFDSRVGPIPTPAEGADFGSNLGLDAWGNHVVAAWTDTRLGTAVTGAQAIGTDRITLAESTPLLAKWPVIGVLFVIGAAALVAALREARHTEAASENKEAAKK